MQPKFRAHGHFEMRIVGRLLVSDVYGPWNAELSRLFWERLELLMPELERRGNWASLSATHGSAILSPEGFALYKTRVQDITGGSKRVAAAIVIAPDVEGAGLVNDLYEEVFRGVCPMRIFEVYDEAKAWALAELSRAAG